ncbi:type II secretion system protein D (GspD) [Hydrogenivirga caldilitoris]|uniref:Type II secretion system protein D (GspD) n=1 Tax=Hydrogenivirga caldilitoris TaxID=246264 RepID=A0A497XXH8_9AQUI|nr:type II secretion system secretin GspD [Hydrogenivirga caldilitoris]RLJ71473.1 type II secretion system protein D (GspD) [Hydrogenivirga caldilitoris]
MKRAFLILLFALGVALAQTGDSLESLAQEAKKKGEVVLNFQEVDVGELALFMGKLIGKNVVVDPAVRGKVTLVFSKPLKLKEAWDVFTSTLFMQGFGVIEGEKTVKVLPVNEAVTVAQLKSKPAEGELATLVFSLRYADAQDAMNAIRPFLSPFARVSVHNPSNSLLIADVGENIEKAQKILSSIDKSDIEGEVRVYRLKHLSVKDAVRIISPLSSVFNKKFGTPLVVSSSEDANALVIFAPKGAHESIKGVIAEIDTEEVVSEVRSFYIIPLQFISAEELSESLQSLLSGGAVRATTQRTYPRPQPLQQQQTGKEGRNEGKNRVPSHQPTPQESQPIPFITTEEGMKIGFDRGTNSAILYGTRTEYESLKKLISSLDIRRKQVLIAATVVEASTSSLLDIGIKWQVLGKHGGASFRGSSLTDIYSSFLSGNFLMGVFSDVGKTVTIGDTSLFFPDLVLLFSLIETGSGFNIVSNPKVLTLDNQPAVIKVGQVVPYAEGLKFDINGQPIITYDYKEVGLELDVTPRISGENLRLTINLSLQEIIDFVTNQIGATSYTVPVTSNRQVNSDVVIENGQTVILGGLVSTKTLKSMEGVPGLWKVPILGRLFRRDVKQNDKTTLFIFITPYVVSSPEELSKITEEHRKLSEEIEKMLEEKKKEKEKEEDEEDYYF